MKGRTLAVVAAALTLAACSGGDGTAPETGAGRIVAVTLSEARLENVREELFSVGRIVSRNTPRLAAEINARVVEVHVDEGQPVRRGQVLIRLDTTTTELERREAQADIERLTASIENDERRVVRYRDLRTRNVMPQENLDDAEAKLAVDKASLAAAEARLALAVDRLARAELISPVDGVVEERHVSVGDYVQVGGALLTLTDTIDLRAELPFPETVGHRIRKGQRLHLESPIAPGLVVDSAVDEIRPQVGSMSRSLVVISDITNPGSWRPEATVEATLVAEVRPDAVVIPAAAVVKRPAGDVVYRVEPGTADRVRQVVVETGLLRGGRMEIRNGLRAGDRIVEEGAHYLSDGASISIREAGDE